MEVKLQVKAKNMHGEQIYKAVFKGEGKERKEIPVDDREIIHLDFYVLEALGHMPNKLSFEKKIERFALGDKIRKAKSRVTLTVEDVILIKETLQKAEIPLYIVGPVWNIIKEQKK